MDQGIAILSIDTESAFNITVRPSVIHDVLLKAGPSLNSYFRWRYGDPSTLRGNTGVTVATTSTGVRPFGAIMILNFTIIFSRCYFLKFLWTRSVLKFLSTDHQLFRYMPIVNIQKNELASLLEYVYTVLIYVSSSSDICTRVQTERIAAKWFTQPLLSPLTS